MRLFHLQDAENIFTELKSFDSLKRNLDPTGDTLYTNKFESNNEF